MDIGASGEGFAAAWVDAVRDAVAFALEAEDAPKNVEISVVILDEAAMTELNTRYRGAEGVTDVLAFPCEALDEHVPSGRPVVLGDIAVCGPVAEAQATEGGLAVQEELEALAIHGTLHLVGYEHDDEVSAAAMEQREAAMLSALRTRRGSGGR